MRGIMKKHPVSVILGILMLGLALAQVLPVLAPKDLGTEIGWQLDRAPRSARALRPQNLRLEILSRELLTVTSKTAPVQFASAVSPQAVNTWIFVEGEDIRWDPHTSSPTQDVGATLTDSDEVWIEAEEIQDTDFILDRDAAATGSSVFAIHYKLAGS